MDTAEKCQYQMVPLRSGFPVWDCVLEKGHDGWHSLGEITLEKKIRIKETYMSGGKNASIRGDNTTVISTGEVPLENVVTINKNGKINKQSTLGKVAALLNAMDAEIKAGQSHYERNGKPGEHKWLEARGNGFHVVAWDSDIRLNGSRVTYQELEEALIANQNETQ